MRLPERGPSPSSNLVLGALFAIGNECSEAERQHARNLGVSWMTIAITDEPRKQLEGILTTHIHNLHTEFIVAQGTDEDRVNFYHAKLQATELLLPLFAASVKPEDEDNENGPKDDDAEEEEGDSTD